MATLSETIKDVEQKRRQLEENVDSLTEEVARSKANGEICFRFMYFLVPKQISVVLICLKIHHLENIPRSRVQGSGVFSTTHSPAHLSIIYLTTVKQDISADMLFSPFSRLSSNPQK